MVGSSSVLRKVSPNGKLVLYLRCRDYASAQEPVDGVVEIDKTYLKNRKIFGHLIAHFRYGREKDEVMGIKFYRDFVLASSQIYPSNTEDMKLTDVQMALKEKLDTHEVYPFTFYFPSAAPTSVTLLPEDIKDDFSKACGVHYFVRVFVGENENDIPHRRSSSKLNIRRIEYAPDDIIKNPSHVWIKHNFMICTGDMELEASLDKQLYDIEESIPVHITIQNNSNKTIKKVRISLLQNVSIQMLQTGQYKRLIDECFTRRPIKPGASFQASVGLTASLRNAKKVGGIALSGHHKREESDIAYSTYAPEQKTKDIFGIVINYFVRVKLHLGRLNSDINAELPIILLPVQPA